MPIATCTDKQFIQIWRELQSTTRVATSLGINPGAARARCRRIERKYGIQLPVVDSLSRPKYTRGEVKHKPRLHYEIEDGVIVVGSDAHIWPGEKTTALKAFLNVIRNLKPKQVHLNGDVFDGAKISRHPKIGFLEKAPDVHQEIDACKEALAEIEDAAGKAELIWEFGNHDMRFEGFLAAHAAQYEGVEGLHLKDHFPRWNACWSTHINADKPGHMVIKHRIKGGKYDVSNNVMAAHTHTVTGHTHALKWFPTTTFRSHTLYGINTGTLANPRGEQFVHYTEDGPTDWRSGFAVLTYWKGRLLQPELAEVIGPNQINFRGEVVHL
jgi:predicted phosphodiesterase